MARGHHYHVRVVINGRYAYDRGGDACSFVLWDIDNATALGRTHDPLNPRDCEQAFGLHYVNADGTCTGVSYSEVKTIRLIFVSRTYTGKRKIKMIREYHYNKGIMSHYFVMPGPDVLFDKDDEYYRNTINTEPAWNIMKEENDHGET